MNYTIILISIFIFFIYEFGWQYPKYKFKKALVEGKRIKKGSIEDIGNFFYYLEHKKIKPFFKDFTFVLVDTFILLIIINSFLNKRWFDIMALILVRFTLYDILKDDKKTYLWSKIKRDVKRYKEIAKEMKK